MRILRPKFENMSRIGLRELFEAEISAKANNHA